MDKPYRLFFILVMSCVGFVMVMTTIAGIGFAIVSLSGASGDESWEPIIYITVTIMFFLFLRRVMRMMGGVTEALDDDDEDIDEARLMQDLHQGLMRMDQRIDSLETILLENAKRERTERSPR